MWFVFTKANYPLLLHVINNPAGRSVKLMENFVEKTIV